MFGCNEYNSTSFTHLNRSIYRGKDIGTSLGKLIAIPEVFVHFDNRYREIPPVIYPSPLLLRLSLPISWCTIMAFSHPLLGHNILSKHVPSTFLLAVPPFYPLVFWCNLHHHLLFDCLSIYPSRLFIHLWSFGFQTADSSISLNF